MNQLAYSQSNHPGSFTSQPNQTQGSPAYAYAQQQSQNYGQQAFQHPGHGQSQYHDGVNPQQSQSPTGFQSSAGSYMMHAQQPHFQYTSAPFQQSIPAQAPQAQQQRPTPPTSHYSVSPQPSNAAIQPKTSSNTPPTKFPMSAPPLPNTPSANGQSQQQDLNRTLTPPKSPSTATQSLEQRRINTLLEINQSLLSEVNRLHAAGAGGATSPQQAAQFRQAGLPDNMASEEYIQTLRRIQANLAYLVPKSQPGQEAKVPPGPSHMTPPPHLKESLSGKYEQLKELFEGWQGFDHRAGMGGSGGSFGSPKAPQGASQQQRQQQQGANGVAASPNPQTTS